MSKAKILIIDDEIDLIEITTFQLEMEGYTVFNSQNIANAIEMIKTQQIDLVISDIKMPSGSGFDLIKQVRLEINNPPKFILVSGFLDTEKKDLDSHGVFEYLEKPINFQKLKEVVKKAL